MAGGDLDRPVGPVGHDPAGAADGVDRSVACEAAGQDAQPVARRRGLLEPLRLRQRVHPRLERLEQRSPAHRTAPGAASSTTDA